MSEASTPEVPAGRGERVVLRISTIILAATLLAFLLPLVAVSCGTPAGYGSAGGGVTATYSGLTLVTGGEPSLNPPNKPLPEGASRDEDRVSSQPGVDGPWRSSWWRCSSATASNGAARCWLPYSLQPPP